MRSERKLAQVRSEIKFTGVSSQYAQCCMLTKLHNILFSGHLQTPHPAVIKILQENSHKCQNIWRLRGVMEAEVSKILGSFLWSFLIN